MKIKIAILFFLTFVIVVQAQEVNSRADQYFYAYNYQQAITAYKKDMGKGEPITNHQLLNLADAYFRTGDYKNATKIYLDINKNDTIISVNRFNMMLQSLAKTDELDRVKAFMNTKRDGLTNELAENADFNFEVLSDNSKGQADLEIFNTNANSAQADFSPSFYNDKLLFSSSRPQKSKKIYEPTGEAYLNIYVARMAESGRLLKPSAFAGIPDSKYHKSTPYYSAETDRMFYILSNTENEELAFDGKGKNALAMGMVYDGGFFRFILRDLSTSFYYPYFDNESGKLYFAANFTNQGFGGTDLYFVRINNGQIMSEPINLGPRINSPGNEIAPFLHEGSLYFSSDIFYGLGGMDVYKSNLQSDDSFSIPVNLGKGINSEKDDFGFIIRANQKNGFLGYFSSNRPGGKGKDDIYGFELKQKPGLKTFALKGRVVNMYSKKGVAKAQIQVLGKNGAVIKEFYTSTDGDFRVEMPWEEELTIKSTKLGHSIAKATYSGQDLEDIQQHSHTIEIAALANVLEEVENKTVLDLDKLLFARNRSDLTPEISRELDKVVEIISKFPQLKLQIETHTDSRGYDSTNKRVSQKRADAIKKYLLKNGASYSNIISATGFGEERILNNCTNGVYCLDFLHEQNVRTLFILTNYDEFK